MLLSCIRLFHSVSFLLSFCCSLVLFPSAAFPLSVSFLCLSSTFSFLQFPPPSSFQSPPFHLVLVVLSFPPPRPRLSLFSSLPSPFDFRLLILPFHCKIRHLLFPYLSYFQFLYLHLWSSNPLSTSPFSCNYFVSRSVFFPFLFISDRFFSPKVEIYWFVTKILN